MNLAHAHRPAPSFVLAPSCPAFPAEWTEAVADAARRHTAEAYPAEAVGIVNADGCYERLENRSTTPGEEIALCNGDLVRVAGARLFFHSHPDGPDCPSEADMRYQQQLRIPFVIQPWPVGPAFCFGEGLKPAPLIGRAFRHGVHDCYTLIRDWYAEAQGVALPVGAPRGWDWWEHGRDLYTENFAGAGFDVIRKEEATMAGDLLLFRFRFPVLMHAAVVVGPHLLLHHLSGRKPTDYTRLSVPVPRLRWAQLAVIGLRYTAGHVDTLP
jgi:cell wall-associated NlpC family hydrolase